MRQLLGASCNLARSSFMCQWGSWVQDIVVCQVPVLCTRNYDLPNPIPLSENDVAIYAAPFYRTIPRLFSRFPQIHQAPVRPSRENGQRLWGVGTRVVIGSWWATREQTLSGSKSITYQKTSHCRLTDPSSMLQVTDSRSRPPRVPAFQGVRVPEWTRALETEQSWRYQSQRTRRLELEDGGSCGHLVSSLMGPRRLQSYLYPSFPKLCPVTERHWRMAIDSS